MYIKNWMQLYCELFSRFEDGSNIFPFVSSCPHRALNSLRRRREDGPRSQNGWTWRWCSAIPSQYRGWAPLQHQTMARLTYTSTLCERGRPQTDCTGWISVNINSLATSKEFCSKMLCFVFFKQLVAFFWLCFICGAGWDELYRYEAPGTDQQELDNKKHQGTEFCSLWSQTSCSMSDHFHDEE